MDSKAEKLKADIYKKLRKSKVKLPTTYQQKKGGKLIPGISYKRFQEIFFNDQISATGYELRMIISFLGVYVYEFEEKYGIIINQ